MADCLKPGLVSSNQPLLVLKYRPRHAISIIVWFSLFVLVFSGIGVALIAFATTLPGKQDFVFLVLCALYIGLLPPLVFGPAVVDRLSFKEIRLYQDRIVRIGIHGGEKAVSLACAKLLITLRYQGAIICHQDTKWFLRPFKCIRYSGEYAEPKDAIKLKHVLAALSGRRVQELEGQLSTNPWIKLTDKPRIVSQIALDNIDDQAAREYLEQKKLIRQDFIAISVAMFLCLLVPFFLFLGFAFW